MGVASFYVVTSIKLSLFFLARIPCRPYVDNESLKVELWFFSHY